MGEVTAKILASGSADVKLTYFKGVKDAKKVVNEISNQGLLANALPTMFISKQIGFIKKLGTWRPTHLYYFATPFIFSGSSRNFSIKKFERFCDYYYVAGFKEIIDLIGPSEIKKYLLSVNYCNRGITFRHVRICVCKGSR